MVNKNNIHGIYIHIPFCRKKCLYCNFYSEPKDDIGLIQNYVDRVILDIEKTLSEFENLEVDTIYFGGGTPSYLLPRQVESLILEIKKHATLTANCEISLEMNPEDVSKTLDFEKAGINRIVLGVQTIRKSLHKEIGRATTFCDDKILKSFFSKGGFSHCIDLIVGIPGQTVTDLKEDIQTIVDYSPDHISAYLLTLEDDTPLSKKIVKDDNFEQNQEELFLTTVKTLKSSGYEHYEISNFCKYGFESKHNGKYWKFLPYVSFGPGSHSFYSGERFKNDMSLDDYISSDVVSLTQDVRSKNSEIVEFFMTGLRLLEGIDESVFETVFSEKIPKDIINRIYEQKDKDFLILTEKSGDLNIRFTEKGLFFSDSVIFELLQDIL